jgi:hypothetical protein
MSIKTDLRSGKARQILCNLEVPTLGGVLVAQGGTRGGVT